MSGQEPEGKSRLWVGRRYGHFVAPRPFLDGTTAEWFDRFMSAGGWHARPDMAGPPFLNRAWVHDGINGQFTLAVLGCYPLLVTCGFQAGKGLGQPPTTSGAVREALTTCAKAFAELGGRPVADAELESCLASVLLRWKQAEEAKVRRAQHLTLIEYRQCSECSARSGYDAAHCRACGRRFAAADDLAREAAREAAEKVVTECQRLLSEYARGEGLFADWPTPRPGSLVTTAAPARQGNW